MKNSLELFQFFEYYNGYFRSFASLIRSLQKINKWTSNPKKLYFPGVDIVAIPSREFFISIDEFVDAYSIPHRVLFDGVPLRGLSFIFIRPTLNLYSHQFTVDFVITFCALYTAHKEFLCGFMNLVLVSRIWLFVLSVCFGFSKT